MQAIGSTSQSMIPNYYEDVFYKDGAAFSAYFWSDGEMVEGTEKFLYEVPEDF